MNKFIVPILSLFFYFSIGQAAELESSFDHMIIFGDSLSDIGNNSWVIADGGVKGSPIVNVDPTTGKKQIWVNDLNAALFPGQKIYTFFEAQKLQLNPTQANIDYAFASAETGVDYVNDLSSLPYFSYDTEHCNQPGFVSATESCVPGVEKQVALYLAAAHQQVNPHTLFIIWAGGNDIFDNLHKLQIAYQAHPSKWLQIRGLVAVILGWDFDEYGVRFSNPVANLKAAQVMLLAAGASKQQILFINLPNIAIAPGAISMAKDHPYLLHVFTAISISFNVRLKWAVWGSSIFSVYDLLNTMVKNPEQYNLTNVSRSCVMDQKLPYCQGYLFYNDKHPTAQVGGIVANSIFKKIIL